MIRRALVFSFNAILIVAAAACGPRSGGERAALTDEGRRLNLESFDRVYEIIRDNHWDSSYNGVDWDAAYVELRPRAAPANSDEEAREVMRELVGRLQQSHFSIIPRETYARLNRNRPPTTSPSDSPPSQSQGKAGLRVRVIDERAVVTKVDENSPAAEAKVRAGWDLVSVDSIKARDVIKDVRAAHGGSPLLHAYEALTLTALFDGAEGERISALFKDQRGKRVTRQITLARPRGEPVTFVNLPTIFIDIESREIESGIGYFWFTAFLDATRVMAEFRAAIQKFSSADGLIIDLRGNPGGIGFMANGMAGYLTDESNTVLGEMTMRQGRMRFTVNPQPETFAGPIAILIDECSLSTSEILASGLQEMGRARVFGTPSPGAALPSKVERLPNGDGFQFAIANFVSSKGTTLEGRGIVPDEIIAPDPSALLEGRDNVIDAAIAWIRSQKPPGGGSSD